MKTIVSWKITLCTLLDRHQNCTENSVQCLQCRGEEAANSELRRVVLWISRLPCLFEKNVLLYEITHTSSPKHSNICVVSGFHGVVDKICALLRNYARFLTLEEGTGKLSRNVGKQLPLYTAKYPSKAQISLWILIDKTVRPSELETREHLVMFTKSCHGTLPW